jgi:hypothetical protein
MSFLRNRNPMRASHSWVSGLIALLMLAMSSAALAAGKAGDIFVVTVHGDVRAVQAGVTTPLYEGAILQLPATIRTGHDGALELRQGPTTIAAAADTELEIPVSAAEQGLIERVVQIRGNAFYNVGKRERTKLRVETPYLVAVIKGTQFNVASYDDSTTIALFEGRLEVRAADDSDVVDLHAGEIAIRNRNDVSIRVLRMSPAARATARTDGAVAASDSNSQPGAADGRNAGGPAGGLSDAVADTIAGAGTTVAANRGDIAIDASASTGVTGPGSGVDIGAAIGIDKVSATTPATVDVGVGVGVNVDGGAVNTDIDAGLDVAGVNASVDAGAAVDLGSGSANVDASVGVGAGSLASADIGTSVGADLSSGTVAADASVGLSAVGGAVSTDVGATTAVDLSAGTVTADTGAAVDLVGTGTAVDTSVAVNTTTPSVSADLTAATPIVDAGASLDVTPTTIDADVSVGGITVAPSVDLGSGTIDLGLGGSSGDDGLLGLGGLLKRRSTQ